MCLKLNVFEHIENLTPLPLKKLAYKDNLILRFMVDVQTRKLILGVKVRIFNNIRARPQRLTRSATYMIKSAVQSDPWPLCCPIRHHHSRTLSEQPIDESAVRQLLQSNLYTWLWCISTPGNTLPFPEVALSRCLDKLTIAINTGRYRNRRFLAISHFHILFPLVVQISGPAPEFWRSAAHKPVLRQLTLSGCIHAGLDGM